MLDTARDLSRLLRTPLGRIRLRVRAYRGAWPLLSRLATGYRLSAVRNTRVVAVVGSFGKTTTARAVTTALRRTPHPKMGGNFSSHLAEAMLRIRPGDRHAVIEVGIRQPGQMARYARVVRPNVVVVTSIGSEHHRSLRSLEVTRAEKAQMVRILPPWGLAVLNGDDPNVCWMRGQTRAEVRTFGFEAANDVRASEAAIEWPHGTRFTLHANGEVRAVRVRLLGRHQVRALLAAVAVALAEGFTLDQVLPGLEALPSTPGRLQVVPLENGAYLLRDDFKSALETVHAALDVLAEIPAKRRIAVLGEVDDAPGSEGPIYRGLGERLGKIVTRAILLGGRKNCGRYVVGAKRAGLPQEAVARAGPSALGVIEPLKRDLGAGDVVLIKGRNPQRLARIALGLAGRRVRCDLISCHADLECDRCPMLERGWNGPGPT